MPTLPSPRRSMPGIATADCCSAPPRTDHSLSSEKGFFIMRIYYDRDADVYFFKNLKVAVIGFGSQGHAHALNMKDSGVKEVVIAARPGASAKKAEAAGFKVMNVADAAKWADVMMMVTPDELQADIYKTDLKD